MKILNDIISMFPSADLILSHGSTGDDFIEGVSDYDVIIVGQKLGNIDKKLVELGKQNDDLDVIYISSDNLQAGRYIGRKAGVDYKLHAFDLYRVKKTGKVLSGDKKVLNLFPNVTIKEALEDTLPHIFTNFLPTLRNNLKVTDSTSFLADNLNYLLVLTRAMCTIETTSYYSKLKAVNYLLEKHPKLSSVLESLKAKYLNTKSITSPSKEELSAFLDFTGARIEKYLGGVGNI